jgi:flagellar biogenesis protein FliO
MIIGVRRWTSVVLLALLGISLLCCAAGAQNPPGAQVDTNTPGTSTTGSESGTSSADPASAKAERLPPEDPHKDRLIGDRSPGEPKTGDDKGEWNLSVLDMLWPLTLVLGGIGVVFWAVRKYVPGMRKMTGSRAVEVLARTYLSPRQSVNIVRLGRRILVVGQTTDRLSALATITDPDEVSELIGLCESASAGSATSSFRNIFKKFDRQFEEADVEADGSGDADLSRVRDELDSLTEKVRRVRDRGP